MKILIYDLETDSVDPLTAEPKLGGFKSSEFEGFKYSTSIKEMCQLINSHDIIVGYNIKKYDNIIMQRYGASFFGKILIDMYEIADKRKMIMKLKGQGQLNTLLTNRSLDMLVKVLGGPKKLIDDVDYNWFKSDFHTLPKDIQEKAVKYLEADIEATEFVYNYFEEYFAGFKEYMTDEQIRKKQYLTSSTASYAYKVLCNLAGIDEEYGDDEPTNYGGGFVALPTVEEISGNLYCLDFSSLYPHIMMMCNLYGRVTDGNPHGRPVWRGTGISYTKGEYYADEMAPVGKVLRDLYNKRLQYKAAKDSREYTIKIIINTIYGLLGKSVFKSVNDWVAAADCTRVGRQWIKHAREHFMRNGYESIYTDTDSVYINDIYDDKERMLRVKDEIIKNIFDSVAFKEDTFDMTIDDEIDYMQFVKNPNGEMLKKNYLYVTKPTDEHPNGEVKVKGFQIIKGNASNIGKLVYSRFIVPKLLSDRQGKFKKSQILQWIYKILNEDISNAAVQFKVKDAELYKLPTQVQRMIAEHPDYGPGQHMMIKVREPHPKGCGVNKNYVGTQFKDQIKVWQIVLDKPINEMYPFIQDEQDLLTRWMKG